MVDRTVAINSLKASLSTCMIFDRVDRESTRSTRAINRPADPTIHDVPRGLKIKINEVFKSHLEKISEIYKYKMSCD